MNQASGRACRRPESEALIGKLASIDSRPPTVVPLVSIQGYSAWTGQCCSLGHRVPRPARLRTPERAGRRAEPAHRCATHVPRTRHRVAATHDADRGADATAANAHRAGRARRRAVANRAVPADERGMIDLPDAHHARVAIGVRGARCADAARRIGRRCVHRPAVARRVRRRVGSLRVGSGVQRCIRTEIGSIHCDRRIGGRALTTAQSEEQHDRAGRGSV